MDKEKKWFFHCLVKLKYRFTCNSTTIECENMTVSKESRKDILEYAETHSCSLASRVYDVSKSSIHNWAKEQNIIFRGGRKRHPKLLGVEIAPYKNTSSRHRHYLLHIHNHTCYDCGFKDLTGEKLQQHLDYNKFPVEVLILCIPCHGVRERYDKKEENEAFTPG